MLSALGGFAPWPGAVLLDPAGGSAPDPHCRLALHAHHKCLHLCSSKFSLEYSLARLHIHKAWFCNTLLFITRPIVSMITNGYARATIGLHRKPFMLILVLSKCLSNLLFCWQNITFHVGVHETHFLSKGTHRFLSQYLSYFSRVWIVQATNFNNWFTQRPFISRANGQLVI